MDMWLGPKLELGIGYRQGVIDLGILLEVNLKLFKALLAVG